MTVPYGMGTEYDRNWEGKERGTSAKIYTFDMNPNIAYKVSDFISIGGGISVQYAKAKLGMDMGSLSTRMGDLGIGHAKLEADSWDWGFNLGVMISPTDKLRFGLAYRSAIKHDADGHTDLTNSQLLRSVTQLATSDLLSMDSTTVNSSASLKTPDTVMLTGTWEATDQLRLSGLIRWANWSNFDTLKIHNSSSIDMGSLLQNSDLLALITDPNAMTKLGQLSETQIENDWQDTWLFSVGADYKINSDFTVRGGIAYETSPIDDQSTRMAVIPDTDRLWLSLGASWYATKDLQFDVGATYLMGIGDKDLYDRVGGKKIGEYDTLDAYLVGVQMQYRF